MSRRVLTALALAAICGAASGAAGGLNFPLRGDEKHFWATAVRFSEYTVPPLDALRSYSDLNTPLPFLIWGWLERAFHQGVALARGLNLALSAAVLWLIVRPGQAGALNRRLLAAAGVLLCPYFLFLSVHAYTDIIAIFFTLAGVHWHLARRHVAGAAMFVLAIASRQFMVAFPLALAVWELAGVRRESAGRRAWLAPALAASTLIGWYALFGDFGPPREVAAQRIATGAASFRPQNGLYLLACCGLYFVLIRAVLFREPPVRRTEWRPATIAAVLAVAVLFAVFPPFENADWIRTLGFFDRGLRLAGLGDWMRVVVFCLFALAAVVTLWNRRLPLILLLANAVVMIKAHQAWDKYALPLIVVLWYLESRALVTDGTTVVQSRAHAEPMIEATNKPLP